VAVNSKWFLTKVVTLSFVKTHKKGFPKAFSDSVGKTAVFLLCIIVFLYSVDFSMNLLLSIFLLEMALYFCFIIWFECRDHLKNWHILYKCSGMVCTQWVLKYFLIV